MAARDEHSVAADRKPDVSLLPHQQRVADDFWAWWARAGGRPGGGWGRIILPPRSGKTVVAAWILAAAPVEAVFVVPTRTLVDQTVRELERWLRRPVGAYSGERKDVVTGGVMVTTYSMLQSARERRAWPDPVTRARLVILDEAHHAMTSARLELIAQGFAPEAARIALTATPDYDDARTLCRFFPDLVHEITVEDALDEGLLAPLRLWVAEVDAKGSEVRIVQGDYDGEALGRVMSTAPFARAVAIFRYGGENASVPAMVVCSSRQQARDLAAYLDRHRPPARPRPGVLLGDTRREERERLLADFEAGRVDTIVQVGVLVEGWNSPGCKLLIDLAPSLSLVRSTQKYFRVMTRHAEREARIYVLLPSDLPGLPVLPTELFGRSLRDYECGTLVRTPSDASERRPLRIEMPAVDGVRVAGRIVHRARLERPLLGRADRQGTLRVLKSCPDFSAHRPPGTRDFLRLRFDHPLFVGSGFQLLRWLEHPPTSRGYVRFLGWVLGSAAPDVELATEDDARSELDVHHLLSAIDAGLGASVDLAAGWRALGGCDQDEDDPESILLRREEAAIVVQALKLVHMRRRRILCQAFGLLGQRERTAMAIGGLERVSNSAVGAQLAKAIRTLRGVRMIAFDAPAPPPPARDAWWDRIIRVLADRGHPYAPGLPFPPLFPPHRRRRAREISGNEYERWGRLGCPLSWQALVGACDELLAGLGLRGRFVRTDTAPLEVLASESLADEAVEQLEVCYWRAGKVKLAVQRAEYAWRDPAGEEVVAVELVAEVGPLTGGARLSLFGVQGHIEAFRVDDASESCCNQVARRWAGLVEARSTSSESLA